ncbi:hypothetical protein LTR95_015771 [Oleoguttula sp. CCFEE 5521]
MCQLLHQVPIKKKSFLNRYHELRRKGGLIELATIADKYDCVAPLRSACFEILHQDTSKLKAYRWRNVSAGGLQIAAAAYVLDQPEVFRDITTMLLKDAYGPVSAVQDEFSSRLPSKFFECFEAQRIYHAHEGIKIITELVDELGIAAYEVGKPSLAVDFTRNLRSHALWPIYASLQPDRIIKGLSEVTVPLLRADDNKEYVEPQPTGERYARWTEVGDWGVGIAGGEWQEIRPHGIRASSPVNSAWGRPERNPQVIRKPKTIPTQASVATLAKAFEASCVGLCLDCLKDNEVCRVPHPSEEMSDLSHLLSGWGFKRRVVEQESDEGTESATDDDVTSVG